MEEEIAKEKYVLTIGRVLERYRLELGLGEPGGWAALLEYVPPGEEPH